MPNQKSDMNNSFRIIFIIISNIKIIMEDEIFTHYWLLFSSLFVTRFFFTCYSLIFTRYLLLLTRYSLLFTRYSLLFTRNLLLFTRYSFLFTSYSLLLTRYSLLFVRYPLLIIRYSLLSTRYFCSLISNIYLLNFGKETEWCYEP